MSFERIQVQFDSSPRPYTGAELRPHFLLQEFGLKGSGMVGFYGPCQVSTGALVDWEDRLKNDRIEAAQMFHFMGEYFGWNLPRAVAVQRLFVAHLGESLNRVISTGEHPVLRQGDDLFVVSRKLSVSIVTASPVSCLIHTGVNWDPQGASVDAIGLQELGLSWDQTLTWAQSVLVKFSEEISSMDWACAKVRPVV